jgi:hypothetical protein
VILILWVSGFTIDRSARRSNIGFFDSHFSHFFPSSADLKFTSDLGKVIGRDGRTAKSIRVILGAAGMKTKKRVMLEILE